MHGERTDGKRSSEPGTLTGRKRHLLSLGEASAALSAAEVSLLPNQYPKVLKRVLSLLLCLRRFQFATDGLEYVLQQVGKEHRFAFRAASLMG